MSVAPSVGRPVQFKPAVDDVAASVDFYREAIGLTYEVVRRTRHHNSSALVFGEYGRDSFFLLWLLDYPDRRDRPGRSNFSLLVDDVDPVPCPCPGRRCH